MFACGDDAIDVKRYLSPSTKSSLMLIGNFDTMIPRAKRVLCTSKGQFVTEPIVEIGWTATWIKVQTPARHITALTRKYPLPPFFCQLEVCLNLIGHVL